VACFRAAAQVSRPSNHSSDAPSTLKLPRRRYLRLKPRGLDLDHPRFFFGLHSFPGFRSVLTTYAPPLPRFWLRSVLSILRRLVLAAAGAVGLPVIRIHPAGPVYLSKQRTLDPTNHHPFRSAAFSRSFFSGRPPALRTPACGA
jgi:hypothetical protein